MMPFRDGVAVHSGAIIRNQRIVFNSDDVFSSDKHRIIVVAGRRVVTFGQRCDADESDQMFEFIRTDGVPIETIFSSGLAAGAAPAGAPLTVAQGNLGIVGGTGAFLGTRGELGPRRDYCRRQRGNDE